MLAFYKSWDTIRTQGFVEVDESNMSLPLSLYQYIEHQHVHFARFKGKVLCVIVLKMILCVCQIVCVFSVTPQLDHSLDI